MKNSYVVYVEVGNASCKDAKRMVKRIKKNVMKKARKRDRWFFIPTRGGTTHIVRLV